jgi:hypothetical protein
MTELGDEVIIDVDHPADHALEVPLESRLLKRIG